ncbi:unnamed protein product, partial [Heterotrigona itama]
GLSSIVRVRSISDTSRIIRKIRDKPRDTDKSISEPGVRPKGTKSKLQQ